MEIKVNGACNWETTDINRYQNSAASHLKMDYVCPGVPV